MPDAWYEVVPAESPLTQGDIIRACRILVWKPAADSAVLKDWADELTADVVVMTQACDLENRKVANVVLAPILPLSDYRATVWDVRMRQRGQNPSEKSWRRAVEDIAAGYVWNQLLMERFAHPEIGFEVSVVEFQDLFTVPRVYLEALAAQRNRPRVRILSPYREYLSQAFARFFMRVGLPQSVTLPS